MVREGIAGAARRAGRDPGEVTLVAVTKTIPVEVVRQAVELGVSDLGENRVQEAARKVPSLPPTVTWHMIGQLQSNKAKDALALFQLVHSLDRPSLARALDRAGQTAGRPVRCLVQVNVTGAVGQGGVPAGEAEKFIELCLRLPYLRMEGAMVLGPYPADPPEIRRAYRAAGAIRDRLSALAGRTCGILSAGMSGDYELAVEEGSTLVRVGTAIFGARRNP